jgi:hypothetical protein
MPWTAKQLKLFRAAAHNPAIAKSSGIKQADAERMSKEGLKKAKGGAVPAMINRQDTRHGKMDMPYQKLNRFAGMKEGGAIMRSKKDIGKDQMSMAPYKKGGEMESKAMMKKEIGFMQKKGAPASMIKHEKAEMKGYKKGGSIKETMGPRNMSQDVEGGYKAKHLKHGEHSEQKRGHTKGTVVKMAAGGSVRAHGEHSIQKKGHTRGKMC